MMGPSAEEGAPGEAPVGGHGVLFWTCWFEMSLRHICGDNRVLDD